MSAQAHAPSGSSTRVSAQHLSTRTFSQSGFIVARSANYQTYLAGGVAAYWFRGEWNIHGKPGRLNSTKAGSWARNPGKASRSVLITLVEAGVKIVRPQDIIERAHRQLLILCRHCSIPIMAFNCRAFNAPSYTGIARGSLAHQGRRI